MKRATTGIVLLWLTAIPAGLFAQEPVDPVRAELALAEEIRLEELRNGP